MSEVQIESTHDLQQAVTARGHHFVADEPAAVGQDAGPTPYEFLLAALGGCTSMTLLMYARRKGIPLESVRIRLRDNRIHAADCGDCETTEGHITEIARDIELRGPLNTEQRNRLLEIASKCPVHRTLASEIKVRDRLAE